MHVYVYVYMYACVRMCAVVSLFCQGEVGECLVCSFLTCCFFPVWSPRGGRNLIVRGLEFAAKL